MPVRIPHRFFERLLYAGHPSDLRFIIIGTYNPGEPEMGHLSALHAENIRQLFSTEKYKKFSQIRNFYDRPPNRFWGIMDRINSPKLYKEHGQKFRNSEGLKFFRNGDREAVFVRQRTFCDRNGIFITDIVKAISTTDFKNVYNNFSDPVIDRCATEFNTDCLIEVIQANPSSHVLFNVGRPQATPVIGSQLCRIIEAAGKDRCNWMPSTSGLAGGSYAKLLDAWQKVLRLDRTDI